jgi:hypothetical protein
LRRGDNKPATSKLGQFSSVLGELRARLQGDGLAAKASKPADDRETREREKRKPLQPILVDEAEKARLAAGPGAKPSWAAQRSPALGRRDERKAPRKLSRRAIEQAQAARERALEAARRKAAQAAPPDISAKPTPRPQSRLDPIAARRQIADRLRAELRAVNPSTEPRPSHVSEATREAINQAVERGASICGGHTAVDLDGYIMGLDLGTSAVKCAYRQPYLAGEPVRCLSVPQEVRSFGHPCLWQTALWYHPETDRFSLTPTAGAIVLEGFKSGLIADQGQAPARPGIDLTRAEASSIFEVEWVIIVHLPDSAIMTDGRK